MPALLWKGLYEVKLIHSSDVIRRDTASLMAGVTIVDSNFCWGADQREHQSSASLAFVRGIHRWPANSTHKGPVTPIFFFHLITSSWSYNFLSEQNRYLQNNAGKTSHRVISSHDADYAQRVVFCPSLGGMWATCVIPMWKMKWNANTYLDFFTSVQHANGYCGCRLFLIEVK